MGPALSYLRNHYLLEDGRWKLGRHHPAKIHHKMEGVGQPSRWITLRMYQVDPVYGSAPPSSRHGK